MEIGRHPNSILAIAPSFSSYTSNDFAEIAAKVIREISIEEEEDDEKEHPAAAALDPPSSEHSSVEDETGAEDDVDGDFEFTFVCQDPDVFPISADDVFSNGQIRPVFPTFNRDIVVEESNGGKTDNPSHSIRVPLRNLLIEGGSTTPAPSSERDAVERIPSGSYCIWKPKSSPAPETPDRCRKSNSTGSSKRWRIRDLLHRSSSDGKETLVFLSTAAIKRDAKGEILKGRINPSLSNGKGKTVSAHELHYVRKRAMAEEDRRRSYLPYRQDLVGFFANVNGLSKSFHPY